MHFPESSPEGPIIGGLVLAIAVVVAVVVVVLCFLWLRRYIKCIGTQYFKHSTKVNISIGQPVQ